MLVDNAGRKKGNPCLVLSFYAPDGNDLSISLASLSAYLKAEIPQVEVQLESINTTLPGPEQTPAGFAVRVHKHKPDLVAFSCMSPHWYALDLYLLELKRLAPEVPILLGGYQAILSPDETIAHPSVDFICVGDGEKPLAALVNRLYGKTSGKIRGLWEKRGGVIEKSEPELFADLATAPYLDYSLFERNGSLKGLGLSIYGPKNKFILPVMTGRGCPYLCSYCCNTTLSKIYKGKGHYLRKYDCKKLITELVCLKKRYAVDYFEFWDELFLADLKFAYQFLDLYQTQVGLPFSINSRVEMMDDRFCRTARLAGCDTIWFGIESGSESYRKQYLNRTMTNEQILAAAENAGKHGIRRLVFNIVGMPFETPRNMRETLDLNRKIRPEHFFFFGYIPLPGTPLYELAKANNLLLDDKNLPRNYQEGIIKGQYRLNIKESPEGTGADEFTAICREMEVFQRENNRLDIDSSPQATTVSEASIPLQVLSRYRVLPENLGSAGQFGIFSSPDESLDSARKRSLDRIMEILPTSGRILLIGDASGALLDRLLAVGFEPTVIGILPDRSLELRQQYPDKVTVRDTLLKELSFERESWDVLLLVESSVVFSLLALFERASSWLKKDGFLVVLDSFTFKRPDRSVDPQHHKDYFIAVAQRFGFLLLKEKNYSQQVLPNYDLIDAQFDQWLGQESIHADFSGFREFLQERRLAYLQAEEGYLLLVLQLNSMPEWRLKEIVEADQPSVNALFEEVFGQPMSENFWRWKYGFGRGQAVGLWRQGRLIAHYGGIIRQLQIGGQLVRASQSCDVMVAPCVRGAKAKRGPFFLVCATFLESFVGNGTSHPLAYGFPNERAYRLPHKLKLYSEPVGQVKEAAWGPRSARHLNYKIRRIDVGSRAGKDIINLLWKQMSRDYRSLVIGVRDAAFVTWRYQEHPQLNYDIFLVSHRWLQVPQAVIVVRKDGERLELLDWIGCSKKIPLIISAARLYAGRMGLESVYMWASEVVLNRLLGTAPQILDLNISVPTNAWTESDAFTLLKDRLWLTGGDTDFH